MAPSGMHGGGGAVSLLRRALADQWSMVRLFLGDRRLRAPVVAIWVASFGGALHEPVTTFFMLELGATTAQMGTFGAIRSVGAWVLGPVYGWLIDKYTAYMPTLLSAFVCALGCSLRGFAPAGRVELLYAAAAVMGLGAANFWNVVQAHLAAATESELRHKVVSAYFVQVNMLSLLGKSAYPLWDAGLKAAGLADERLLRFRITMSVCSVFCIFGVFNLLLSGQSMREVKGDAAEEEKADEAAPSAGQGKKEAEATEVVWGDAATFLTVSGVLVIQAAGQTAVNMLWPLYVSHQFGWQDHAYAWLSLAASLAAILSASVLPALAQRAGAGAVATVLCGGAAVGTLLGFPAHALASAHVLGALAFSACSSALKPCLEALASLAMPARFQGRSFAALKLADAFGQTLGNYFGARLFDASSDDAPPVLGLQQWLPQMGGGALPFVVVGLALFASTSALAVTLLPQHWKLATAPAAEEAAGPGAAQARAQEAEHELAGLLRQRVDASRSVHAE
mmetsp:Transcript_84666/g.274274  ORF Transcript_84666/g.274274 Transcript_84666/m.274274 type:complete len:509 (+) Transcript_84666:75-1601(+)